METTSYHFLILSTVIKLEVKREAATTTRAGLVYLVTLYLEVVNIVNSVIFPKRLLHPNIRMAL